MRVRLLDRNERLYSSNVYLVLGDWNRMEDVNTLVDAGANPAVLGFLRGAATGVGKKKLDQLVLTHRHYDHATMVEPIRAAFDPVVCAFGPAGEMIDRGLEDGEELRFGDEVFEVIHVPGHTDDSICLYGARSRVLFAGDTPLLIHSAEGSYQPAFFEALRRVCGKRIDTIYFGHGDPLADRCNERLDASLRNVEKSCARGGALTDMAAQLQALVQRFSV